MLGFESEQTGSLAVCHDHLSAGVDDQNAVEHLPQRIRDKTAHGAHLRNGQLNLLNLFFYQLSGVSGFRPGRCGHLTDKFTQQLHCLAG